MKANFAHLSVYVCVLGLFVDWIHDRASSGLVADIFWRSGERHDGEMGEIMSDLDTKSGLYRCETH